ncbi:MAG: serine protease [Pseudomonadota bacterium]
MLSRWYPPGALHQWVFEFLRLYCQTPGEFMEFVRNLEQKRNGARSADHGLLQMGYVNKQQLLDYFLYVSGGVGVAVGNPLARIYDALIHWDVFSEIPLASSGMRADFQINFIVVQDYQRRGVLENIVKGPHSLFLKYRMATAAIVVEKDGQESIGSGSVVSHNGRTFVLTNRHVIDPQDKIAIKYVHLADQRHPPPDTSLIISKTDDLAAFATSVPEHFPSFSLGDAGHILQEVILLGFPKIPLTVKPHLTAHSGEINAIVETRTGERLYLISNYASPGSSGGPLIDYRGLLVGVVSDSLEAEYEKPHLLFQHSAAVTLDRVRQFVQNEVMVAMM